MFSTGAMTCFVIGAVRHYIKLPALKHAGICPCGRLIMALNHRVQKHIYLFLSSFYESAVMQHFEPNAKVSMLKKTMTMLTC